MSVTKEAIEKARELYDYFDQYPITIEWKRDCAKFVCGHILKQHKIVEYKNGRVEETDIHAYYSAVMKEIDKIEC